MNHPVDDIFKKGLEGVAYEDYDTSWPEAKRLLGLRNKRKRGILWLLFFAALSIGAGIYLWSQYTSTLRDTPLKEVIVETSTKIEKDTEGVRNSEAPQLQEDNEEEKSDHRVNDRVTARTFRSDNISQPEDPEFHHPEVWTDRGHDKSSIDVAQDDKSSKPKPSAGAASLNLPPFANSDYEQEITKGAQANPSDQNSIAIIEDIHKGEKDKESSSKLHLPRIEILAISRLPWIDLLLDDISPPTIEKISVKEEKIGLSVGLGAFAGIVSQGPGYEGGLLLTYHIGNNWYIDIGLGYRGSKQRSSSNTESQMLSADIADFNDYEYSVGSVFFPILLNKRVGRGNVSLGFTFERPLTFTGQLSSGLNDNVMSLDNASADPMVDFGVESVQQTITLMELEEFDRWHTSLQLNGGWYVRPKSRIDLGIDYRWSGITFLPDDLRGLVGALDAQRSKLQWRLRWIQSF